MCYFYPSSKCSLSSGKGSLIFSGEPPLPTLCPYGCHGADSTTHLASGEDMAQSQPIKALVTPPHHQHQ